MGAKQSSAIVCIKYLVYANIRINLCYSFLKMILLYRLFAYS